MNRHPRFFEPAVLALVAPLCVFGAIIGIQVMVSLGAVTWPGDLDLSPDAMHREIKERGKWIIP